MNFLNKCKNMSYLNYKEKKTKQLNTLAERKPFCFTCSPIRPSLFKSRHGFNIYNQYDGKRNNIERLHY